MKKPLPVKITPEGSSFRNGNFPWEMGYKNFYSHNSDGSEGVWYGGLVWYLEDGVRKAMIGLHNQTNYASESEDATYLEIVPGCTITTTQYGSITGPYYPDLASAMSDIVVRGFGNKIYCLIAYEYTSPSAGGGLVWVSYDLVTEVFDTGYLDSFGSAAFVPSSIDILSDGTDVYACFKTTGSGGTGIVFMKWDTPASYKFRSTAEVPYFGINGTGYCYFYTSGQKYVQFDYDDAVSAFTDLATGLTEVPTSASYAQCYCSKNDSFVFLITATKTYWSSNGYTSLVGSDTYTTLYAPIWNSDNEIFAVIYDEKYIFLDDDGAVKFFILPLPDLYLGFQFWYECGWHEDDGDFFLEHITSFCYEMQYVSVDIIDMMLEYPWHEAPICTFAQRDAILDSEFIRLYDDYNNRLIEGYARKVKSDKGQAYACEIDSKIQEDLQRPIVDSITGTRKEIAEALVTDYCDILTLGTFELDDITDITKTWDGQAFAECLTELCQDEGDVDWYYTKMYVLNINNLDTPAAFAIANNYAEIDDDYSNTPINKVTVWGKWSGGVQAVATASSGATIYVAIEVQEPNLSQAECETRAANLLANRNLKYYTYWISGIFGQAVPDIGTLINVTDSILSLSEKPCYIKRLLFNGVENTFDLIVTDTFVFKIKEMNTPVTLQAQISQVAASTTASSHTILTVAAAPNPLTLNVQLLEFKNEAGNKITVVETTTISNDAAKIPSSALVFAVKGTADSALPKAGGTMTGNIAFGGSYKLTGLAAGSSNGDSVRFEQLHNAVTIGTANGLSLSTQILSMAAGTTSAVGTVQLEDSVSSTSTTKAATPNSVKTAYDKANAALPRTGTVDYPITGDLYCKSDILLDDTKAIRWVYGVGYQTMMKMSALTLEIGYSANETNFLIAGTTYITLSSTSTLIKNNLDFADTKGISATHDAIINAATGHKVLLQVNGVDKLDIDGTDIDCKTQKLVNVTDPTAAQDAATKAYVDTKVPKAAPKCIVTSSSSVSVNNGAWATLTWNTEITDTDTMHDNSTNNSRITIKTAGKYKIFAHICVQAAGAWYGALMVDGSTVTNFGFNNTSGWWSSMELQFSGNYTTNQYLEVKIYNATGGNSATVGSSYEQFGAEMIYE